MNPIRMLALDLDDTLLRSDLTISNRTRTAVKKAEAAGVAVVLASGRVQAAMEQFSRLLGMNKRHGYLICNNGSIIHESHSGKVLYEIKLDSETAITAYDIADAEGFPVQLYEDDVMYVSRSNEFTEYDQRLTGLRQVVVENFRDMVNRGCHKLLIPGDPILLAPLENLLRNCLDDDITLFTSKPYFLEILPKKTDKGSALAKIAAMLEINSDNVMAIGDSMNDAAMLSWAGVSVAMANADARIKEMADIVSENTNNDDGVAQVIEKYILAGGTAQ